MKYITTALIAILLLAGTLHAQDHRFDPPWNTPPAGGVAFTVPGIDNILDLYGDMADPQLVIFFAGNTLAIMVQSGNPKKIKGMVDLGRKEIRVSMPNPAWEGIGKRIEEAYVKAGGPALQQTIMVDKVAKGSTYLTKIHHRETPMRMLYQQADAGPVWFTEVYYQQMIHHPVSLVTIPEKENIHASYWAGILKSAPHPAAAKDFMSFLMGPGGQGIYKHFGFTPPEL